MTVAFALFALTVPAQLLVVADGATFSPKSAVFLASLGFSVLVSGIFALELIFLGCTCGVAFSLSMPILHLDHRLRLLALRVFAADLLTGCPCVCV